MELIRSLVRPIITLSFTGLVVYLAIRGDLEAKEIIAIYATILGFWFAERKTKNQQGA